MAAALRGLLRLRNFECGYYIGGSNAWPQLCVECCAQVCLEILSVRSWYTGKQRVVGALCGMLCTDFLRNFLCV